MTKIAQIIAEVERLKEIGCPLQKGSDYQHGYDEFYTQIKKFINSLPTEQPSEDLEKEIERFQKAKYGGDVISVASIACHFAIWQKEQMMKSAIEVKINRDTLYNLKPIIHEKYQELKIGDKILIIKEDEQ